MDGLVGGVDDEDGAGGLFFLCLEEDRHEGKLLVPTLDSVFGRLYAVGRFLMSSGKLHFYGDGRLGVSW